MNKRFTQASFPDLKHAGRGRVRLTTSCTWELVVWELAAQGLVGREVVYLRVRLGTGTARFVPLAVLLRYWPLLYQILLSLLLLLSLLADSFLIVKFVMATSKLHSLPTEIASETAICTASRDDTAAAKAYD